MESYVCLYGDERMLMYGNYCTFFHTYMFMADQQPVCCMSRMEMSNNYKLQIRLFDLFLCTFQSCLFLLNKKNKIIKLFN